MSAEKSMEPEATASEFINGGRATTYQRLSSGSRRRFLSTGHWKYEPGIQAENFESWVSFLEIKKL